MEAESKLAEVAVASNNGATSGEPQDPAVLKEKLADELKSAASLKGGGDGPALDVPLEKDDLLERLDKIDTDSTEAVNKASADGTAASTNDTDMENDDLIQRLEAMEKGEEEASPDTEEKKEEAAATATEAVETNHQNGLEKENEAELLQEDEPKKEVEEKMEVDASENKKEEVSSTEPTSNGTPTQEEADAPTSSVKRRHSQDDESQTTEPSTKKAHVDEEVDSVEKTEASEAKPEDKAVEAEVVEAPKDNEADKKSVEKVEEPAKTEGAPVAESTVTEEEPKEKESTQETEEKVPSEESVKEDEKSVEEKPKEDAVAKEVEEPMEVSEVKEQPAKAEEVAVAEPKEEVDSTPVVSATESSEVSAEPEKAAETEAKVDSEAVTEEKKQVEEEAKTEETVASVSEEKPAEEAAEASSAVVAEEESEKKVDEVKKTDAVNSTEEPTTSESVEEAPKASEEKEATSESVSEQAVKEAESESEALPDTEPNTESSQEEQPTSSSPAVVEEKSDDAISSSSEKKEEQVLPSSTEVDSAVSAVPEQPTEKPCEVETVTSSDEKPSTEPTVTQEVDSTPEVPATAAEASAPAKEEEPMEVDSEPVVEESSKVDAPEPPCTKKEAYQCTEESAAATSDAKPQEPTVEAASEPTSAPVAEKEPAQKDAEQEDEKMEVDSAAPSQSKPDPNVTESMNTTSEELIESIAKDDTATAADSQSETTATVSEHNKNLDAGEASTDDSKVDASKTLDDSIECSLPTSSSDKMADRLKQRLDLISNGSSTPNAAVSSSNVYNSTPIQKQFEISSENVSKISHSDSHQADEDHSAITVGDQSIADEKEAAVASTSGTSKPPPAEVKQLVTDTSDDTSVTVKDSSSSKTESSEVDSCTASSALNTADEINLYATNARKFNGISSTSGSELEDKSTVTPTNVSTTDTPSTVVNKLDLVPALTSDEALYEVNVWFDGAELQFLSIEKMENKTVAASSATAGSTQDLTGIDSSKQSSNGSVGSLGPFSLPPARPTTDSAMSHSTATEASSGTSQIKASLPKMKHTVRGAQALATLMIEEFTKIKKALSKEDSDAEPATPMKTPRGRPAAKKTSATPASVRGQKRSRTDSETTEEEAPKSKQPAKQAKKGAKAESEATETDEPAVKKEDEQCCLARWSDRKYYAGKVAGFKGDNKYMIVFEDGASKALARDVIVFGEKDTLPIMGHSVHALTGDDTYEPGIVEEIKRNDSNEVVYSVKIDTGIVEVTSSDMYLTEEQAKHINKACKAAEGATDESASMQSPQTSGRRGANTPVMQTPEEASATSAEKGSRSSRRRGADKPQTPVTPEAGYSGGVGAKKGRRGRRLS
ncbi:titin homolog isoform X2 [Aedes aegypti]|uniref:Tumour suppressor p53-binding protein-1 Tudor domain-containing protein n=1 Tax=Aedes aegypti TaxID=7159 RepID=A0A6I8TUG6_AEDAE|nr:titin homolog isoform X2 [Aedes aegypti]